jgi:hypothetical protein
LSDALARAQVRASSAEALEAKLVSAERRNSQLAAENELVHDRLAELFAKNEEYDLQLLGTSGEIERLNGILNQIYGSRTWKLHLLLDRLRGRR